MSLLEGQLSQQSDPTVKNLVQELFKGEYSYVTKCVPVTKNEQIFNDEELKLCAVACSVSDIDPQARNKSCKHCFTFYLQMQQMCQHFRTVVGVL